ncbi:MAG: hypothetical protein ACRDF0_01910, partial [Candidatus Limnocylindria bacterium]
MAAGAGAFRQWSWIAEDLAEPRAVGDLYASAAITREREGDLGAALAHAQRALAEYERMGVAAHVGNMWNTIGRIYIGRKQHARAADALGRAERIAGETDDDRLAAYVLQNRAELALARGEADGAVALAQESIDHRGAPKRGRALSVLV